MAALKGFTLVEITLSWSTSWSSYRPLYWSTLNIAANAPTPTITCPPARKSDLESIQKPWICGRRGRRFAPRPALSGGLSERCVGTGSEKFNLNSISWTKIHPTRIYLLRYARGCKLIKVMPLIGHRLQVIALVPKI